MEKLQICDATILDLVVGETNHCRPRKCRGGAYVKICWRVPQGESRRGVGPLLLIVTTVFPGAVTIAKVTVAPLPADTSSLGPTGVLIGDTRKGVRIPGIGQCRRSGRDR